MTIFIFCHLHLCQKKRKIFNGNLYQQKKTCVLCPCRVAVRHVKVKPRCAVLTMLKRLDKIRFRGPRTRDDFPDLAESPPASDNECSDDMQLKPKTALRDTEDLLRDPVSNFFSFPFFNLFYYTCVYVLPFFLFLSVFLKCIHLSSA